MNLEIKDILQWAGGAVVAIFPFLLKYIETRIRSGVQEHEAKESARFQELTDHQDTKIDGLIRELSDYKTHAEGRYAKREELASMGRRFEERMERVDGKLDKILDILIEEVRRRQ